MASAVNNTEQRLVFQFRGGEVFLAPRVLTVLSDDQADAIRKSDFCGRLIESGHLVFNDTSKASVQESLFLDTVSETEKKGKEEIRTVADGDAVVTTGSGEKAATVYQKRRSRSGVVNV